MKTHLQTLALLGTTALAGPALAQSDDACAALSGIDLPSTQIRTASPQGSGTLPPDPMSAMTGGSPRPVEERLD